MSKQTRDPINWPAAIMFIVTSLPIITILPWYFYAHGVSVSAWVCAGLLLAANGMAITGGYHRLWAHRAYTAQPALKWCFAIFGGMAMQNSILVWASGHRVHHRHVDDVDHDPYSAKRGFWFSHIGWMLRDYPASQPDFSRTPDLLEDRVVLFQHRHYLWFALGTNLGIPVVLGVLFNDLWGFVLIAGFLRLVISHHVTFLINSLAHAWGRQPFTGENTARDNDLLALFTWGEGYHNYHHMFQWDYRNGIRWWQFDPTKWLIAGCAAIGLAKELKRVPDFKIQRARVMRQFERAREALASGLPQARIAVLQVQLEAEWLEFTNTIARWTGLQGEKFSDATHQMQSKWEHSELRRRLQGIAIERELRSQRRRVQVLRRRMLTGYAAA